MHPIVVTVPIGAWVCSLVFDVVSFVSSEPRIWSVGAMWLILLGAIGGVVAAVLGGIDLRGLPHGTAVLQTARIHAGLNSTATGIFVGGFIWRYASRDGWESSPIGPLIMSIIGLALVGAAGFLGGKLAYHYGVRVADESVQAEGFRTSSSSTTT